MICIIILFFNFILYAEVIPDSIQFSNQDYSEKDFLSSSYKIERWLSSEGNSEGASEVWLDRYFEPRNINLMNYDDILAFPSLSPIDANAVIVQQKRGYINGTFELKNSPGISRYGYKNLINFIDFDNSKNRRFHFRYSSLIRSIPITTNPDVDGSEYIYSYSDRPGQFHKVSSSFIFGENQSIFKIGGVFNQEMGQPKDLSTTKRFLELSYIPILKTSFQFDKIVIGNFSASFGQGVIFENTDHFSPRRTGYGFTKRNNGINSDLTRTSQYVLDGLAFQISNKKIRFSYFRSEAPRDAIINQDLESFSSLIVMQPRLPWGMNEDSDKVYDKITSSIIERTMGWNLRLGEGSNYVGFSFYRSLYNKYINPSVIETILGGADDDNPELDISDYDDYSGDAYYLGYYTNSADPEIAAMYFSNPEFIKSSWDAAKSFRRVLGADFSKSFKNIVFQGEYAEMPKYTCLGITDQESSIKSVVEEQFDCVKDSVLSFGNNPKAMVLNAFAQFDNINFLLLYRKYDLEFDNPYHRSFSNYQRYKTSIFEDTYWLEDPVYGFLHSGNPQPQSEEGVFFSSRYQAHRSIVLRCNIDAWNRLADNTRYYRTVVNFEWRPVFNYRIYIRQKWQERGQFNIFHPSPYDSRETVVRFLLRLSNYDNLQLTYIRGYTTFSPRPRLTDSEISSNMLIGDIGSPDISLGFSLNHNMDNRLAIKGGSVFVKGFIWYIEDTDFRVFDSESGAIHNWVSIRFRPVESLSVNLKYTITNYFTSTTVTEAQTTSGYWIDNPAISNKESNYRIQIDYAF